MNTSWHDECISTLIDALLVSGIYFVSFVGLTAATSHLNFKTEPEYQPKPFRNIKLIRSEPNLSTLLSKSDREVPFSTVGCSCNCRKILLSKSFNTASQIHRRMAIAHMAAKLRQTILAEKAAKYLNDYPNCTCDRAVLYTALLDKDSCHKHQVGCVYCRMPKDSPSRIPRPLTSLSRSSSTQGKGDVIRVNDRRHSAEGNSRHRLHSYDEHAEMAEHLPRRNRLGARHRLLNTSIDLQGSKIPLIEPSLSLSDRHFFSQANLETTPQTVKTSACSLKPPPIKKKKKKAISSHFSSPRSMSKIRAEFKRQKQLEASQNGGHRLSLKPDGASPRYHKRSSTGESETYKFDNIVESSAEYGSQSVQVVRKQMSVPHGQ